MTLLKIIYFPPTVLSVVLAILASPVVAEDLSSEMVRIEREVVDKGLQKQLDMGARGISYLDPKSIELNQGRAMFNLYIYYPPKPDDAEYMKKRSRWKTIQRYQFDCTNGDWRIVKMEDFLLSGKTRVYPESMMGMLPFQKNVENAESDVYYKTVCKTKK